MGNKNVKRIEQVERVRRLHRNDLENIPIFFAAGALFLQINPPYSAIYYFWTFTIARVLHTFSYLLHLQPWRALTFLVGVAAIVGMTVQVVLDAVAHLNLI